MLLAGTNMTGTTLAHLFYELARNSDWLLRLRAELASFPSRRRPPLRRAANANKIDKDTIGDAAPKKRRRSRRHRRALRPTTTCSTLPVLNAVI
jgi:cytochrome P450